MATLDARLEDGDYRRWVKAALCIQLAKDGLVSFATLKSQELYDSVLMQLQQSNNPSAKGICNTATIDRWKKKMICCQNCQAYVTELQNLRTKPLNLGNSDITTLYTQPWQMAKLMMNPGQDVVNIDPSNTDISGILNFIGTCTLAMNDIQNKNYIDDVQKMRNRIIHTADMKVTENDFLTNITPTLIQLLQDPKCLLNNLDAQDAVDKINETKLSSFQITKKDEYKALKDMITNIRNLSDCLHTTVYNLETKSKAVELKTGSDMEKLHSELTTGLHEGQSDIKRVEELLQKLTQKVKDDAELVIKLDKDVTLICDSLAETHQQMQTAVSELTSRIKHVEEKLDDVSAEVKERGKTKTRTITAEDLMTAVTCAGIYISASEDVAEMADFFK